ncbi:MAG: hypothetical protein ABSG64_13070 [Solirubrobacteraceae bacterium]|jgi:hypothetical protein
MKRLGRSAKTRITLTAGALLLASPVASARAATGPTGASGPAPFTFTVTPNAAGAPGGAGIQSAINVFAAYSLYAAAGGFLIGAALWAMGGVIGNDYTATGGKKNIFIAAGCAFLVGSAAKILSWAYGLA